MQSVMACLNLQNNYFTEHLLKAAFIRFRSTCFSEQLKSGCCFLNYVFMITFYVVTLKNFSLLTKLKDFDFFKVTHFT